VNPILGLVLGAMVCTVEPAAPSAEAQKDSFPRLALEVERETRALEQLRERLARIEEQIKAFEERRRSASPLSDVKSRAGSASVPQTWSADRVQARRLATPQGMRFALSAQEAPAIRAFEALSRVSGLPLQFHPGVSQPLLQRRIWTELRGSDLLEALQVVAGMLSLDVLVDRDAIVVGPISAPSDEPFDRRLREMAVEAYQRALLRYPASPYAPRAYVGIARYYERTGFYAPAIQVAENVLDRYPDSPAAGDALLLMGRCREATGDLDGSRRFYLRYVDSYPAAEDLPDVLLRVARTWMQQDDYTQAKAVLEQVIRGWPESPAVIRARLSLAECLARQSRYDRAMAQLRLAEKSAGDSATPGQLDFMMAECLMKLGRYPEARRRLAQVVRSSPEPAVAEKAYYALGDCFLAEGSPVEALEAYRGASARFPKGALSDTIVVRLCRAYLLMGLDDKAAEILRQAPQSIRNRADLGEVLISLARRYSQVGEHQKVLELTSHPRWQAEPQVLLLQASALLEAGMPDRALEKARAATKVTEDEALRAQACLLAGRCRTLLNQPVRAAMAFGGRVE